MTGFAMKRFAMNHANGNKTSRRMWRTLQLTLALLAMAAWLGCGTALDRTQSPGTTTGTPSAGVTPGDAAGGPTTGGTGTGTGGPAVTPTGPPGTGSPGTNTNGISAVNHVVYMIMENRSFDHYFAKLNDYRAAHGFPANVDTLPPGETNPRVPDYQPAGSFHLQTMCIENTSAA